LHFAARRIFPNFHAVKRALAGLFLGLIFVASIPLRAADAVALAAQQEIVESNKRLLATVEELQNTQAAQQKQISTLMAELGKLRDEISRNNNDAANKESRESIRKLGEQIVKVDDARIADNKRFQEALERLGETFKKTITTKPVRPMDLTSNNTGGTTAKAATPRGTSGGGSATEEGFEYIVVSGDRPDKIAAKYQAEKINVTAASIIKANPSVDWTKLQVGQKLFIPKPK
jgi:LysM repeat protein